MERWVIRFGGSEWSDATATTAHLVMVAELVGDDWKSVSPWNGPRTLAAWLAVLSAAGGGTDLATALEAIYALPVADLLACLSEPDAEVPAKS